jgi:hypothetical protein
LVVFKRVPGKILTDKVDALGLPRSMIGKVLTAGEYLHEGTLIRSTDIQDPS